jgi:UDP-N-acetylmuramoyl-tripeptide--D-alanyl-D-alanine ligase
MVGADGARFTLVTPIGEAQITLALPGRHNVRNALAAAAMALGCDVPLPVIVEGLAAARPVAGRQVAHALPHGAVLVDDSYNANPGSLDAAIATLAASTKQGWLVLGDMRELGPEGAALHAAAGARARQAGIARLYALGELSAAAAEAFGAGARRFDSHAALVQALSADLDTIDPAAQVRVLVKGSRGSAMDRIVSALLPAAPAQSPGGTAHAA